MSLAKSDPRYVPPAVRAERKAQNDARFAERLELIIEPFIQQAREQGRREVLREIAVIQPFVSCDPETVKCGFCRAEHPVSGFYEHTPSCLWLRAQAVKASE